MVKKMIGKKLKASRLKNDMTIQELAARSRVSSNMISRIERGLTTPSVEILMKLAGAFGMSINYFVEEAEKGMTVVHTQRGGGVPVFFFEDKHRITSISQGIRDPSFSVFYDVLEAGVSSGDGFMVHTGDEFALVQQGKLEFTIGGDTYLLDEGDSLAFKASLPHRWQNRHSGQTVVLWVISPPPPISS